MGVKRVPAVVKKPEHEGDGGLQEQEGNVGEVHGAAIFVPVTLAADADRRRGALVQVVLRDAGDVGVIGGAEARMAVELFCTTARADGELLAAREGKDIGQCLPAPLRADAVAVIEGQPLGVADDERRTLAAAEVEPEGAAQRPQRRPDGPDAQAVLPADHQVQRPEEQADDDALAGAAAQLPAPAVAAWGVQGGSERGGSGHGCGSGMGKGLAASYATRWVAARRGKC